MSVLAFPFLFISALSVGPHMETLESLGLIFLVPSVQVHLSTLLHPVSRIALLSSPRADIMLGPADVVADPIA